ncbi:MAG: hypothetical protein NZM11_10755 [Anaerolineales bacterium]|nr:hypothetical protein [Anaerolineales bacterium]
MEAAYHIALLQRALGGRISARALEVITRANLGQDGWRGLLFHPEYHCDEDIPRALAYIEACRAEAARATDPVEAWTAFGRLTHAVQDFYAHTNYVRLWAERFDGERPPAETIDSLDPELLQHPRLFAARVYLPLELLYYLPALRPWLKRTLPADSHAAMNLDNPETGPLFPYAMEAARQRTIFEFERTLALIGETQGEAAMQRFLDLEETV